MSASKWSPAGLPGYTRGAVRSSFATFMVAPRKFTALLAITLAIVAAGDCAIAQSPQLKSIAWSPDSKRLLSGGFDGEVRVEDAETGKVTTVHRSRTPFIIAVDWSPDGRRLLAVTDQTVELLDVHGKEVVVILVSPPLEQKSFPVYEFPIQTAFSPRGDRLALAGWSDGRVEIIDAQSGRTEPVFRNISRTVSSISWSPDGNQVAAGSWDNTVRLLDVESHEEKARIEATVSGWVDVTFSPDGKRLAWHGFRSDAWLRDIAEGSEQRVAVRGGTISVAWSPDGTRIALLGPETLHIWNAEAGVEEKSFTVSQVDQVVWSPDGQYVAAYAMYARASIWNVRTAERRTMTAGDCCLAFSPDMRFIATGQSVEPFSRF